MKRLAARLSPRTLSGQLLALLLVALFAIQAVGFVIYSGEQEDALRRADRIGLLERTASVLRMLEGAPPELRPTLAENAGSRRIRFWVSEESVVDEGNRPRERPRLATQFERMLGDPLAAPPRIAFVYREDGTVIGPGRRRPPPPDGLGAWQRWRPWRDERFDVVVSVPFQGGAWLNAQTHIRGERFGWAWPALLSTGLIALLTLAIVALIVRRATRPLGALAAGAEAFGRGGAATELAEAGPSEVRRLTAAFNRMQQRLSRFVADRTLMLAAIGHDLRTPITALRIRAELVEDTENRSRMLATLDEMQRMTEATLAFSREDAGAETIRTVDLDALIASLADDWADLGRDVAYAEGSRLPYQCRPTALKRALANLVENAVRYGGKARITLAASAAGPVIAVEDDGPGIPEDRLDDVFKPFVRLEASRSRETGGAGLGLAITRSSVLAMGGELVLANRPEGGLRAEIRLPAG